MTYPPPPGVGDPPPGVGDRPPGVGDPPPGAGDQGPPPPDPYHYQPPYYQPPIEAYRPPDQAYPAPAYQYGYGSPYGYSGYPPPRTTDGLAIASLVVSCVAVPTICLYGFAGLLGVVGAILGHVARRRIRTTGAGGAGMALAGIIVGWVAATIAVLAGVALILLIVNSDDFTTT